MHLLVCAIWPVFVVGAHISSVLNWFPFRLHCIFWEYAFVVLGTALAYINECTHFGHRPKYYEVVNCSLESGFALFWSVYRKTVGRCAQFSWLLGKLTKSFLLEKLVESRTFFQIETMSWVNLLRIFIGFFQHHKY